MASEIDTFILTLHESKREAAHSKYKELQKVYEQKILKELNNDQNAMSFVDLAIYPFTLGGKLAESKYRFYCVDPLFHLTYETMDVASFDVLLLNTDDNSSIFIECKSGSIQDNITEKLNKKIETVKAYFNNEFGINSNKIEFVLMAPFNEIEKLAGNLSTLPNVIVWAADFWKALIKLHAGAHENTKLNSSLLQGVSIPSFNKIVNIMPSSHPGNAISIISALLDLVLIKRETESFTDVDVNTILSKEFGNYPERGIKKIVKHILSVGVECGVFSKFSDNEFGINVGRRNGAAAINARQRYLNYYRDKQAVEEIKEIFGVKQSTLTES